MNFNISKTIRCIVLKFHMVMFLTMLISILSLIKRWHLRFRCYFRFMVNELLHLFSLFSRWIFLKLGGFLVWIGLSLIRFSIIIFYFRFLLYFRFSRSRCVATHQLYVKTIRFLSLTSFILFSSIIVLLCFSRLFSPGF